MEIIVSVVDITKIHQVADQLKDQGMFIKSILPEIGIITGSVDQANYQNIVSTADVAAVEEEKQIHPF